MFIKRQTITWIDDHKFNDAYTGQQDSYNILKLLQFHFIETVETQIGNHIEYPSRRTDISLETCCEVEIIFFFFRQ